MIKQRLQRQSACLLPEYLGFAAVALLQLCKCIYGCQVMLLVFCSHTGLPFIGVVTQAVRDKVQTGCIASHHHLPGFSLHAALLQ